MKWPMYPFEKVAEVVTGNTPPKSEPENYGPGVPWVKPPDLDSFEPVTCTTETLSEIGQSKARLLPAGSVMVCCIASVGKVGISGTAVATNQQINSLIFKPVVEPKFGYYYCRYISHVFQANARHAVVPILNKGNFQKIEIPVPANSEQRRIVEILDQADQLRKLRTEVDKKAERILPALFNKMFGDPDINPMNWPKEPLADHVEIGTKLVDPNDSEFTGLPHIGAEHIEKNSGKILDYTTTDESNLRSNKFTFSEKHILYSKIRPYLNKVAFPRFKGVCSADVYPLLPRNSNISPWYLVSMLRSNAFLAYAQTHSDRLRMPKLNKEQLGAYPLPIPDSGVIMKFDAQAENIDKIQTSRHSAGIQIESIFSTLLQQAFSGTLTASWREAHMKELLAEMEQQAKYLN
ncbi:MAG: restriction endonuclease subunit S [Geobacteraceae bacterium]